MNLDLRMRREWEIKCGMKKPGQARKLENLVLTLVLAPYDL